MKQRERKLNTNLKKVLVYHDSTLCELCGSPNCSHRFRNKYLCEECLDYILSQ